MNGEREREREHVHLLKGKYMMMAGESVSIRRLCLFHLFSLISKLFYVVIRFDGFSILFNSDFFSIHSFIHSSVLCWFHVSLPMKSRFVSIFDGKLIGMTFERENLKKKTIIK